MTLKPKPLNWAMASRIIIVQLPTIWLTMEAENEEYAEAFFKALAFILNKEVALEAVHREGTTVSLEMKILPEEEPLEVIEERRKNDEYLHKHGLD